MPRFDKRVTFRQRRLIRHLRRPNHASVQDAALHELHRSVRRTHRLNPPKPAKISGAGTWRHPSRKMKALLSRLRKARSWQVKKQIIAELAREVTRGRRTIAERARSAGRRVRAAARNTRQRGQRFRKAVQRAHEPLLARAERQQRERAGGTRLRRGLHRGRQAHGAYNGPFRSRRAHRRWSRQNARARVPGVFARFTARQPAPARPAQAPAPRGRLAPSAPSAPRTARQMAVPAPRTRPAPARTR